MSNTMLKSKLDIILSVKYRLLILTFLSSYNIIISADIYYY